MTEQAYKVTLRRTRPRPLLGGVYVTDVATDQLWLDLWNKAQVTDQVADLIRRCQGDSEDIESYQLVVADLASPDNVLTTVRLSYRDLEAIRDGTPVPGSAFTLRDVSDEALLQEVARRLLRLRA
jgi:hypothetical protein